MRGIARQLRVGTVWENCNQPVSPSMPWGGYKLSGVGREMGEAALAPFQELKSVVRGAAEPLGWYPRFRS